MILSEHREELRPLAEAEGARARVRLSPSSLRLMKRAIRGAGEEHHNYVPNKVDAKMAGVGSIGSIGRSTLQVTGRPQPRGALVITESLEALELDAFNLDDSNAASVIIRRLMERGWEVLVADRRFSTQSSDPQAKQRLDRNATKLISRLPKKLATQLSRFDDDHLPESMAAKPWEVRTATDSAAEDHRLPQTYLR